MAASKKRYVKHVGPIETIDSLRDHLKEACRIELSTIPVYLYALYSLKAKIAQARTTSAPAASQRGAYETLRGIVIEEMLHLLLARNLLTAVGGDARFCDPDFVPTYPSPMLHREPELTLKLAPATDAQLAALRQVETPGKWPPDVKSSSGAAHYHSLAQLYGAIEDGFSRLDRRDRKGLWANARPALQLAPRYSPYWNQDGGGAPVLVTDLQSAKAALDTIVLQGEGNKARVVGMNPLKPIGPDNPAEPSHYEKLGRILDGYEPRWPDGLDAERGLWPAEEDPDPSKWPVDVRALASLFDGFYCYVLRLIDAIYETEYPPPNDKPHKSRKYKLVQNLLTGMGALLYPVAELLVAERVGKDGRDRDVHAGPTFRFRAPDGTTPHARRQSLLDECARLGARFPSLVGANSPHAFLSLLECV